MSNKDISLDEIKTMLREKQSKINDMESMSIKSRKNLELINKKIDAQNEQLLQLLVNITDSEQDVSSMDSDEVLNKQNELTNKINKVLDNLRNIRNSLAEIIR
jgi:DNA-binding transcriptional MerR regulator|tara:strand:- start:2053 stop:2361 length:309 start_codon:yes stop_codon:yes gene_type:complete